MYKRGETLVCTTMCTGVGKHLYVQQCVQVWGNTCMYNVYRCRETPVCTTVCTGVGKHMYVQQYVQVWGNIRMYNSMYRCEEMVRTLPCHATLAERHCFRWTTITSEISFFWHPTWLYCGFYCWRKQLLSFCCCIKQIHFFWRALVAISLLLLLFFFLLWETTAGYWEHNVSLNGQMSLCPKKREASESAVSDVLKY